MIHGAIGNLDVAQVVLYAFWLFFAGLIWYLRGEDRREGYPLEESNGRLREHDFVLIPEPKTFRLANGKNIKAPNYIADTRPINATKVDVLPGSPFQPTGDPMLAAVGPGSYADRIDETDKTAEGHDLIAPLRVATNYAVSPEGGNPLGATVVGADRIAAGTIVDVWVDRAESILRFYEVKLRDGGKNVLLPVNFADVDFKRKSVKVNALLAAQFINVPTTKDPDRVTMLEEEKVSGYYGGGTLYATPERAEPLL
jgi:photosynthetic reaction center H subunit